MEENKVVEMGMEAINKANGNLGVVAVSAVGTLLVATGVYFGIKKGKEAVKAHKAKKAKAVEDAPEKETKKK
jgi:hypothetical protein